MEGARSELSFAEFPLPFKRDGTWENVPTGSWSVGQSGLVFEDSGCSVGETECMMEMIYGRCWQIADFCRCGVGGRGSCADGRGTAKPAAGEIARRHRLSGEEHDGVFSDRDVDIAQCGVVAVAVCGGKVEEVKRIVRLRRL